MSLLLLRPASVLVLAYGLSRLTREQVRKNRLLLGMSVAWLALPILQLIPLPPSVWHSLPGREIVVDIDREAGLGDVWRPVSLVPYATMNSAWALLAPIATLVLGIQIEEDQRSRLLLPIILLGVLSAAIGLLQIMGDPNGPLYFYHFTNNGMAVGLLANRNHQAALLACLMPMLAAWTATWGAGPRRISSGRGGVLSSRALQRWLPPFAGAAIIIPLILTTGSRSGLVFGLAAVISLPLVVSIGLRTGRENLDSEPSRSRYIWVSWLFPIVLIGLVILTAVLGRAISLNRIEIADLSSDARLRALPIVLSLTKTYLPWGSGFGTFEQVYYLKEPDRLLSDFYMNHAHCDWLELVLTGGLPAVLLVVLGLANLGSTAVRLFFAQRVSGSLLALATAGFVIILIFSLASVTDYPLRVPSLACLGALAVLWLKSGQLRPVPDTNQVSG